MNNNLGILVIGDIILDHYLSGITNRISPEAPIPIVECTSEKWVLGGAANVANNLISLGAYVGLIGILGEDENSRIVKQLIHSKNICDLTTISKNRKTTFKSRITSSNHQLLRIDKEDRHNISNEEEVEILKNITTNIRNYKTIIISDYNKGLLTNNLIKEIIDISKKNNIKVLVDPKSPPFSKYHGAFIIKPNKKEAYLETGINIVDENTFFEAANQIKQITSTEAVVITLSEEGVGLYDNKMNKILPTKAKDIFDVTGAGDTFIATLAYSLTIGKSIIESCEIANYASGVVVGKYGCVAIEIKDIEKII